MIKLKKNDKLIIFIAVIIIIVAAIGIAAYNPPEEITNDSNKTEGNLYTVDWELKTRTSSISDFASKNSIYENTYSTDQGNLKEITFNLSWVDDKAPILGRFGLDTLTLKVTTPDGTEYEEKAKSARKSRKGNVGITISVNNMPSADPIEADDSYDAEEQLMEEPYYNDKWVNEEFIIKVGVQIGEIRPLKKLADKGNNFNIDITYEYYYPTLIKEETKPSGSDNDFGDLEEENYIPPYLSMIIGTGCGRYI